MNWSSILSGSMMFILMSIVRLLFYINIPISNGKKIIKILSIPDIGNRDNGGEILVFLYQCSFLLLVFMGFIYQNILRVIVDVMPPIRDIDNYITFGLFMVSVALPVVLGLIISKMYRSKK